MTKDIEQKAWDTFNEYLDRVAHAENVARSRVTEEIGLKPPYPTVEWVNRMKKEGVDHEKIQEQYVEMLNARMNWQVKSDKIHKEELKKVKAPKGKKYESY